MSAYIPERIRHAVIVRAGSRCEYCRFHQDDLFLAFEVEHIVSQKHGGGSELGNLALSCQHCNQHKGTDLTTFLLSYDDIVTLFNPRQQVWSQHFETESGLILPKSRTGEATIKLLQFNQPDLVTLRKILTLKGMYP